jgi:hypothetical protein
MKWKRHVFPTRLPSLRGGRRTLSSGLHPVALQIIRREARRHHTSMSALVLFALEEAMGIDISSIEARAIIQRRSR